MGRAAACERARGGVVPVRQSQYTGPANIWEFLKIGFIALFGIGTIIALMFALRGRRQDLRSLTS